MNWTAVFQPGKQTPVFSTSRKSAVDVCEPSCRLNARRTGSFRACSLIKPCFPVGSRVPLHHSFSSRVITTHYEALFCFSAVASLCSTASLHESLRLIYEAFFCCSAAASLCSTASFPLPLRLLILPRGAEKGHGAEKHPKASCRIDTQEATN